MRLECERRESKARLRVIDAMMHELEDQLLYVAQFKKEWLQHRRKLEDDRQEVVHEESVRRGLLEEAYTKELNNITRQQYSSTLST